MGNLQVSIDGGGSSQHTSILPRKEPGEGSKWLFLQSHRHENVMHMIWPELFVTVICNTIYVGIWYMYAHTYTPVYLRSLSQRHTHTHTHRCTFEKYICKHWVSMFARPYFAENILLGITARPHLSFYLGSRWRWMVGYKSVEDGRYALTLFGCWGPGSDI